MAIQVAVHPMDGRRFPMVFHFPSFEIDGVYIGFYRHFQCHIFERWYNDSIDILLFLNVTFMG